MILLIDSNGLAYRSKYVLSEMTHENSNTEIIYGFLSQILSIMKKFGCCNLVFAWDSRHSKRLEMFPEYRQKRKNKKDNRSASEIRLEQIAHMQFAELRKHVLPGMGFSNVLVQRGYEADDIIASLAMRLKEEIIIISSDKDLYQCLDSHVKIYSPATKKLTTEASFKKEFGIPGYMWRTVKTISGCRTDDVPGVPYRGKMMGEGTAIKYLIGNLPKTHPIVQAVDGNRKMIESNELLVGLPMPGTREFALSPDDVTRSRLMTVFKRYGLSSFLTGEWWSWVSAFGLLRRTIK